MDVKALMRARARERDGVIKDVRAVREKAVKLRRVKEKPAVFPPASKRQALPTDFAETARHELPTDFFETAPPSSTMDEEVVEVPQRTPDAPQAATKDLKAMTQAKQAFEQENASAHQLPVGFFDDKAQDMEARGVDHVEVAKKRENAGWAAFEAMASAVTREENDLARDESTEADDEIERRKLEQAWYERYRLAPLLAKADRAKLPEDDELISTMLPEDSGRLDIAAIAAQTSLNFQTIEPKSPLVTENEVCYYDEDDDSSAGDNWRSRTI